MRGSLVLGRRRSARSGRAACAGVGKRDARQRLGGVVGGIGGAARCRNKRTPGPTAATAAFGLRAGHCLCRGSLILGEQRTGGSRPRLRLGSRCSSRVWLLVPHGRSSPTSPDRSNDRPTKTSTPMHALQRRPWSPSRGGQRRAEPRAVVPSRSCYSMAIRPAPASSWSSSLETS